MAYDAYYFNGRIVTETGQFRGGVLVKDGRIAGLLEGTGAAAEIKAERVVDLRGRVLFPGVVDQHVHWSEPGRDYEGYEAGSRSAAAGGVTTALEMPLNDLPPTSTVERLQAKRQMVEALPVIDYANWGGLIQDNLDDIPGMHAEGAIGFKAFMKSAADYPRIDDDLLFGALEMSVDLGTVISVHAENEWVLNFLTKRLKVAGRSDRPAWLESHTEEVEFEAIQRALYWTKVTGGNLLVVHISISAGVKAIAQAKLDGVHAFSETCGHYLYFDSTAHDRLGSYAKTSPPIRPRAEVEALWECVLSGQVDAIATDHSPFPPSRHEKGRDTIWEGGGVTGVQSNLVAMVTEGIHRRGMDWSLLARLMCGNPARLAGIYPRKGSLLPGADADFVVIDPDREWKLEASELLNRHQHSPYIGETFRGRVEETVVRGTPVYQDGKILVKPGYGQLLRRQAPLRTKGV
jgi:allantoinase